jgi:hypothetical protein
MNPLRPRDFAMAVVANTVKSSQLIALDCPLFCAIPLPAVPRLSLSS